MIWEVVQALEWLLGGGRIALDTRETPRDPVGKLASLLAQGYLLGVGSAPNHTWDELVITRMLV